MLLQVDNLCNQDLGNTNVQVLFLNKDNVNRYKLKQFLTSILRSMGCKILLNVPLR